MPGDPADDSRSFTSSHIGDKVENSPRPQAKTGPGLRPGAIQPRRLARPGGTWSRSAERETPLLKPGVRPGFQPKNTLKRGRSRATPLRPKAAHANQPAGLVCRNLVPRAGRSAMRDKMHPCSVRSRTRDKVPVKGEPSPKDGSLHERAWRAKSISRSAERDCFFV